MSYRFKKMTKKRLGKKISILLVLTLVLMAVTACGDDDGKESSNKNGADTIQQKAEPINMPEVEWQTETKVGEDVKDVMKAVITFNGSGATIEGEGVKVEGNIVTIQKQESMNCSEL